MVVAQRSDKGGLEGETDARVSRNLKIKELEHKLEDAKKAKQTKELEHQAEMLQAVQEIEKIEYDLEILKNTETSTDLELPADAVQIIEEPHDSQTASTQLDAETNQRDPPTAANAGDADQAAPKSSIGGYDLSRLELRYYQEIDLPDDGTKSQFLDMELEQLYETAEVVETTLESDQQLLNSEPQIQQLSLLGSIWYFIFSITDSVDDLQNAIENTEKALQEGASNINHPKYALCLKNLITMLMEKYNCTKLLVDLDQAILRAEEMIKLGHFDQPHQYLDLFRMKAIKGLQTGSAEEVEELCKEMDAVSKNAKNRANKHIKKFKETGDINDMRMAIRASEEAVAEPGGSQEKAAIFVQMAYILDRSNCANSLDLADLNIAVKASEEALATTHRDDPNWLILSKGVTGLLKITFRRAGNISDLQKSIKLNQEVLERVPDDHPSRLEISAYLASLLISRYDVLGNLDDLHIAIKIGKENRKSTSDDQGYRCGNSVNLSRCYYARFERMGDHKDLDAAVDAAEEALSVAPTSSDKIVALSSLGVALQLRFENTHNFDDLQKAIEANEKAVATENPGDPGKSILLNNLSRSVCARFSQTRNPDDLQYVIGISEKVLVLLDTARDSHSDRANCLFNIAINFLTSSDETGVPSDFEKAINLYQRVIDCIDSPPGIRHTAAVVAFVGLADKERWVEASRMADSAVKLLPLVAPRQIKQQDQQDILKQHYYGASTSMATSIALEAGENAYHAVQLLELGRGVITGLRFGARTDLSELKLYYPEMAERFEQLRDVLDSGTTGSSLVSLERINARNDAGLEFEKTIDQIRQLPNFKNFLLPPDANQLMAAASKGPIALINVSQYRCDAFLVESHAIKSVHLPDLYEEDIEKNAQFMKSIRPSHASGISGQIFRMLEWLWDTIVNPVLNELGFTTPPTNGEWPHVWWIPTGQLSLLPLHAAGYHSRTSVNGSLGEVSPTNGICPTPNTTIDRVISSYSSSIKALLYSRQNSRDSEFQSGEALLVAMDKTPIHIDLRHAAEEVNALEKLLPNQIKQVKLARPCKQAVLNHLKTCSIFHFAGHGESNPSDPSQSSLLVDDWQQNPLTVENLIELNFREKPPLLAYLSACSTSNNSEDELQDEAIHLVTACQLAGFKHVVGSLWEVSDMYSVTAAKEVYKTMVEDGTINADKVPLGVHRATRLLRDITSGRSGVSRLSGCEVRDDDEESMGRGPRGARPAGYKEKDEINHGLSNPLIWAPYVHVGA